MSLAVDLRWLLMVASIAGCKPCQAMRHNFISIWIKYFYKWCVPRCLIYSSRLITGQQPLLKARGRQLMGANAGLPSPMMGCGVQTPLVIETERKILGRPSLEVPPFDIPSPTGMIEDLAVVEGRYMLAKWLKVDPNSIPTDKVSYTFPFMVWVPCVHEGDYATTVSLRFEGRGKFMMYHKGSGRAVDIAWKKDQASAGFLDGRLNEELRPLCFFDRPGPLPFFGALNAG